MIDPKHQGNSTPLREAFRGFEKSTAYWRYPISVRGRFQQAASWWPARDANTPLGLVNAAFAKRQRDRAAQAQGWRAGNFVLVLLQVLIADAVTSGFLKKDRVRLVPKILPPRQYSIQRRTVRPIRHRTSVQTNSERETSSG